MRCQVWQRRLRQANETAPRALPARSPVIVDYFEPLEATLAVGGTKILYLHRHKICCAHSVRNRVR